MTLYPFGETVTLIHRAASSKDAFGNDVLTDTNVTVDNVPVWPLSETEQLNAQDQSTEELWMVLPTGYTAQVIDAVTVYGKTYEVTGEPKRYQNPFTGMNPGTLVHLRRAVG